MLKKVCQNFCILSILILVLGIAFVVSTKNKEVYADQTELTLQENVLNDSILNQSDNQSVNSSIWVNETATKDISTDDIVDANIYGQNVKIIRSAEGLASVAYNVNSGIEEYINGTFILANDIDLSGRIWTPIGTNTYPFSGVFMGEGHVISNLSLDYYFTMGTSKAYGLFGYVSEGSISEVVMSGTVYLNESNYTSTRVGNLVGNISNSEIINCRDNTLSKYNTIGNYINTSVFMSSTIAITSFSSENTFLTRAYGDNEEIQDLGVLGNLTGIPNYSGYVLYFYGGQNTAIDSNIFDFYVNSLPWQDFNGASLRVIVNTDMTDYTGNIINNFAFTTFLPSLRENLGVDDVNKPYILRYGYKATFPNYSYNSCLIYNDISWSAQTISAVFDMGYGTRSSSVEIPYDMPYNVFLTLQSGVYGGKTYSGKSYMLRAGYSINTIVGSKGNNVYQDGDFVYKEGKDRFFYYGFPSSSGDTIFNWESLSSGSFNFRFLIEDEDYQLGGIDYQSLSSNISNVSVSGGTLSNDGKIYQVSSITSGSEIVITFTLNAGYEIALSNGTNLAVDSDNINNGYSGDNDVYAGKTSGVYLNFIGFTGLDPDYSDINANNDNYNEVSLSGYTSGTSVTEKRTYTLTLSNIVGQNGNVYIVVKRASQLITINTNFNTLLPEENKIDNSFTWTYLGNDYTQESFVVEARYNQPFTISFLIGASQNNESDYYILSTSTGNLSSPSFDYVELDSVDIGNYIYYKGFTLTGKIGNLSSTETFNINIGELRTSVQLKVYDENNNEITYNNNDNTTKGMNATINSQNIGLGASGYIPLRSIQQDQILFTTNGYYTPTRIEVIDNSSHTDVRDVVFEGNYQDYDIFVNLFTGEPSINYIVNIYVTKTLYTFDWSSFTFNIDGTIYSGDTDKDFLSGLFILNVYKGDNEVNSFLPNEEARVVLTMTDTGKSILYGDSESFVVDNSNPGSVSDGFISGTMTKDASQIIQGIWAFDYIVGTYQFNLTFNFSYKQIEISVNGLVLQNDLDIILNDSSFFTGKSGTYTYSYNGSQVSLSGDAFGSISIHTQYYLLGWYLNNGNVQVQTNSNYDDITSSQTMIGNGYMVLSREGNSSSYQMNVQGVVGQRFIQINYNEGNAGKGQIIASEIIDTNLYYDTPITLQSPFVNKGYTFAFWEYLIGGQIKTTLAGNFSLTDGDWSKIFDNNTTNDLQVWTSFVNDSNLQTASIAQLTLTANWSIINYSLIIDGKIFNNILQIGDEIRFVTNGEKNGDGSYYIYRDGIQSGSAMESGILRGYISIGFSIQENNNQDDEKRFTNLIGENEFALFTFDNENFDSILNNIYNQQKTLNISTERQEATYKIYIENSQYYDIDVQDNNEYYGEDESGVYVIVTYNKIPTILDRDSEDFAFNTNTISGKAITLTRKGYYFSGLFNNFDAKSIYLNTSEGVTLSPIWTKNDEETVQANINWTSDEVANLRTFVLLNDYEIVYGNLTDLASENQEIIQIEDTTIILSNGEQLVSYGFIISYNDGSEQIITKDNFTTFNINSLYNNGQYYIKFFVTVKDTLYNTENGYSYDRESEELNFVMTKNTLSFDSNFVSAYNGTNEFVPTLESEGYANINDYGRVYLSYAWNGNVIEENQRTYYNVEQFFRTESFVIYGGDYSVGANKDLQFNINTSYFSTLTNINGTVVSISTNWAELLENVETNNSDYIFTYFDGLTIERARFTINFGKSSTYYFDDVELIVYIHNGSNITFTIGSKDFTYNLNNIIYIGQSVSIDTIFTGENNSDVFKVNGLEISGETYDIAKSSFEYVLEGEFTLFASINALKLSYTPRYLIASDGELLTNLSYDYVSIADSLFIGNIYVDENLVQTNSNQFTYQIDNQVLFSFVNNNSPELQVYVNSQLLANHSLTYDIFVDISQERLQHLTPLTSTSVIDMNELDELLDTNFIDPTTNALPSYSFNIDILTKETTTYIILTDVRKVNISYNGGHNLQNQTSESIYVSSLTGEYILTNPTHDYSGLNFAGYNGIGDDPTISKNGQDSYIFKTNDGGMSVNITALWELVNIDATQIEDSFNFKSSLTSLPLDIADIINQAELSEGSFSYSLSNENYTFIAVDGIFNLEDNGKSPITLTGNYTLKVNLDYTNLVQGTQTIEKTFNVTINVTRSEIGITNNTTNILTFNNSDRKQEILIGIRQNNNEVEVMTLENLLLQATSKYGISITITYSLQELTQVINGGDYSITIQIASGYENFFSLENNYISITQTIEKDIIELVNYQESISLSKDFGLDDPSLVSTITINENNYDQVDISFTREDGEAIGNYRLLTPTLVDEIDRLNYIIDDSNFEDYFEIKVPDASLYINLDGTLSYIYNGQIIDGLSVSYDSIVDKYVLTGFAGSEEVKQTFDMFYMEDDVITQIPQEEKENFANYIQFTITSQMSKDVGSYSFDVSLTEEGSNILLDKQPQFTSSSQIYAYIVIEKKTINVTKATKVFDQSTSFTWTNNLENIGIELEYSGIVSGDTVTISGNFQQSFAGNQKILSMTIDKTSEKNYTLVYPNSILVIPSQIAFTVTSTTSSINYGSINKDFAISDILTKIPLIINNNTINAQYYNISDFTFDNVSTGGYLQTGQNRIITFTLSSSNYTFGQPIGEEGAIYSQTFDITLNVNVKDINLSSISSQIIKYFDNTTNYPSDIDIDISNYGIESGDNVYIDKERSFYADSSVGTKDVTIILAGNDSANYLPLANVTGTIKEHIVTFNVIADEENENLIDSGGEFVNDGQSTNVKYSTFTFTYPNNYSDSQLISQMTYPTRTGYTAVGWKYYSNGQYIEINEENIQNLVTSVAMNNPIPEEKVMDVYTVWEIDYYHIIIEGTNIQSVNIDGEFYNPENQTVRYFSDLTVEIMANRGYKISSFNVESGVVGNSDLSDTNKNNGIAYLYNIGSPIKLQVNMAVISVTINIDDNIPAFTARTDNNLLYNTYGYDELDLITKDNLPLLTVTEGTYLLVDYLFGINDDSIQGLTLKTVVDQLYDTLVEDIQISIKAKWQGVTYEVSFNANGGELSGVYPITIVYGEEITQLPIAYLAGRSYAWVDTYNVTYEVGDKYHTIGQYSSSKNLWQATLTARYTNNPYILTIVFNDKILASVDGQDINSGDTFTIVYSENSISVLASSVQGYGFMFDTSALNGQSSINSTGNEITIYNLTADGVLTINSTLGTNRLILGNQKVDNYVVEVDGQEQESGLTEYIVYTESVVKITYKAVKGYEFDDNSVVYSDTSSNVSYTISDDKQTLTLYWSDFVYGITINVTATASINTITIPSISDRFISLQFNGTSVSVNGGQYQIKSDTPLTVTATLKYGYMGGEITSSIEEFLLTDQTCSYSRSDGLYHLTANFSGINDSFELKFSSYERSYNFVLVVAEGQEEQGEIVSQYINQTVSFNSNLILQANVLKDDYIFLNWTFNNTVLSMSQNTTLAINSSLQNMLESVELNDNIVIYANFVENLVEISLTAGNRGHFTLAQEEMESVTVNGGRTIVATIKLNKDIVIQIQPDDGYEIDTILIDNKNLVDCGYIYILEGQNLTISPNPQSPFSTISITFKASDAYVHVQAVLQVNYEFTYATDEGGLVYIADENGNKADESAYLNADGTMYFDYDLLSKTDATIFFIVEEKSGFNASISSASPNIVVSEYDVNSTHLYAVSGVKDGILLQVIFTASENSVQIKFVNQNSITSLSAGKINVDTTSTLVKISQNNTSNVTIKAITGANVYMSINSQFAYDLMTDDNGKLLYKVEYLTGQFDENAITAGLVKGNDPTIDGFTKSSSLQITNINADAIIYIYVEPKIYDLIFKVSYPNEQYEVLLEDALTYGEIFSISSLSDEDREIIFPSREGFTLDGYYTKEAGQGTQYVDRNGNVLKAWTETGYTWDGNRYVADSNFNPATQTFTIYAAWLYNKAILTIDFIPEGFDNNLNKIEIEDIIVNLNQTTYWTSQNDKWYAEVSEGTSLKLQAYQYEGYEFMYWQVSINGGEPNNYSSNFEMVYNQGNYLIKAIYYPKFTLTTNNEGGETALYQNDVMLTGNTFSPEETLTIVATPANGYNFLYWRNVDSNTLIYGQYDSETGSYTYTFSNLITSPLNLIAVFEGKPVNISVDSSSISGIHKIIGIYLDNVLVNNQQTFTASVGQTIKIIINQAWGYGVSIQGAIFNEQQNQVTGYYEYLYKLNANELTASGEGYLLDIVLNLDKEKINLTFNIQIEDNVDNNEVIRAGNLVYISPEGLQIDVSNGNIFQILYGDSATLRVYPSTNYKVSNIIAVVNSTEYNVMNMYVNDELIINQAFTELLEAYNIQINVVFARLTWLDEDVRAKSLLGLGTEDKPYFVRSASEMAFVAYAVNNGLINNNGLKYSDAVYRVVADIDFYGRFWEPIGTQENPFNGTMYLESYDLSNITLYKTYSNPNVSYGGLFWCVGENANIYKDNSILAVAFAIIGGIIILLLLLLLIYYYIRKRRKMKMQEIANS